MLKRSIGVLMFILMSGNANAAFCDDVRTIIGHSDNGFASIKGQSRTRASSSSRITLPGADECYIRNQVFWCVWKVDSRRQIAAETKRFAIALAACLPGASFDQEGLDESEPSAFINWRNYELYVAGDSDDVTVNLSVERK